MDGWGDVCGAIELVVGVDGEGGRVVSGGRGGYGRWAGVGDSVYAVDGSGRNHAFGCGEIHQSTCTEYFIICLIESKAL